MGFHAKKKKARATLKSQISCGRFPQMLCKTASLFPIYYKGVQIAPKKSVLYIYSFE